MNVTKPIRILAMMEAASITGPAKNLLGFCRWLQTEEGAQTRLSIAIATFDRNARVDEIDSFAAAARAARVQTHVIRERRRFDLGVISQLREVVCQVRPDILQTHNNKSHLLVRALPNVRANRLWFAFQHGHVYSDIKQRIYNEVDRMTLRAADRVVSVCEAFSPRLVSYGVHPDRIRILHNSAIPGAPIADPERTKLRQQLGLRNGETVVLSIGRLSKRRATRISFGRWGGFASALATGSSSWSGLALSYVR